jgi:hypothetical protein
MYKRTAADKEVKTPLTIAKDLLKEEKREK